jgi:hypothetical protein
MMARRRFDYPLPPLAWIATSQPRDGTFAHGALDGDFYWITCYGCRREIHRSARQFCAAGWGDVQVVGCQPRLICEACGHRGAMLFVGGSSWKGPPELRPADWAETAEARMPADGP